MAFLCRVIGLKLYFCRLRMKVKVKNIAIQSLSLFLCLQMFGMVAGKIGWVSDILMANQPASHSICTDTRAEEAPDSNQDADDAIPPDSAPDQEKECSEETDYFYVASDAFMPEHFIPSVRQKLAVLADASPQASISDITSPPPKPCLVLS